MKKKNIGFILFGVAGVQTIIGIISLIVFLWLNNRFRMPYTQSEIIYRTIFIFGIAIIIQITIGLVFLIKFRNI